MEAPERPRGTGEGAAGAAATPAPEGAATDPSAKKRAPCSSSSSPPPKQARAALPADAPFTAAEVETALGVVRGLARDLALFDAHALRELRKAMEPLVAYQLEKRYGRDALEFKNHEAKAKRRREVTQQQQRRANDRKLIDSRRLRAERLRQLTAMMDVSEDVPAIPDGAVYDGVNLAAGQSAGTSSVPSIQNGVADGAVVGRQITLPWSARIKDSGGSGQGLAVIVDAAEPALAPTPPDTSPTPPLPSASALADAAADSSGAGAAPAPPSLVSKPRSCYVCKCRFYELHHFYDQLCPPCAELNFAKRMQVADLRGKVVLLTGGRVKVGYQILLKVLRAGASVVVTSRFPVDTSERLAREPDFGAWRDRVKVYGVDFRDLVAVEDLCATLNRSLARLDVVINNACQTIRRPPAYYAHLLENELAHSRGESSRFAGLIMSGSVHGLSRRPLMLVREASSSASRALAAGGGEGGDFEGPPPRALSSAEMTQVPLLAEDALVDRRLFPAGVFDVNAQQVDMREQTSWTLKLEQVSTPEVVEVMAVNSIAPLVICGRLKALMARTREADRASGAPDVGRYIVNVSSMEGKMYRKKDPYHAHTNMAKASLNMMTRTSAQDYAKDGIFMTAVDTGWLNIEAPVPKAVKIAQTHFQTPIDEVDGAARVLDPVFSGMAVAPEHRLFGVFLKDFRVTEW